MNLTQSVVSTERTDGTARCHYRIGALQWLPVLLTVVRLRANSRLLYLVRDSIDWVSIPVILCSILGV